MFELGFVRVGVGSLEGYQAGACHSSPRVHYPCSLSPGACPLHLLISTPVTGASLKELSLELRTSRTTNSQKKKKNLFFFPVLFAKWEERSLIQDIWDFGGEIVCFAPCSGAQGCPLGA